MTINLLEKRLILLGRIYIIQTALILLHLMLVSISIDIKFMLMYILF